MLTVVQRGGGTRGKPPQVVRGMSSRLYWAWDNLCFAVPFNDASLGAARDVVSNAAPSASSGVAWSRDNRGNVAVSLGTSSYIEYAHTPMHSRPTTAITMYVRLQRIGSTDASGGVFCTNPCSIFMDDFTTNAVQAEIDLADTTAGNIRSSYVLPTNLWVSMFIRWQSGTAPELFMLGERGDIISSYTYVTMTGPLADFSVAPFRLNSFANDTTTNSNAAYSQAMMWSRRLTDTEMSALVEDPYGWYSPRRTTVSISSPYLVPFGGGEMHGMSGGMGGMY